MLNDFVSYLETVSILLSIGVSGWLILRQIRVQYMLSLRNKSIEYSLYSRDSLRQARINIEHTFKNIFELTEPISIAEIKAAFDKDRDIRTDVLTVLAHWENMALAIDVGVADEDVCFDMVAGTMIQHVKIFHNFIEQRRESNNRSYSYLLNLKARWEMRLEGKTDLPKIPGGYRQR